LPTGDGLHKIKSRISFVRRAKCGILFESGIDRRTLCRPWL